jgi:membrane fusion protein (multidrug efflux system)
LTIHLDPSPTMPVQRTVLNRPLPQRLAALSLVAAAAAVLAACGPSTAQQGGPGGAPPPTPVGVVTVQPGNVALSTELPGRLEASRTAQVRARATGIVQQRLFTEGADVKAGQPLFKMDAAPYEAALDSARATQAKAQAALTQATATLERNRPLAEARAISQSDWVATQAAHQAAVADLAATKAAVKTAAINLDYTSVKSPISGRVGRALVSEGSLVSAAEATQLALVQQTNPMYINFTQSASEAARLRKAFEAGTLKRAGGAGAQVQVVLEDGSTYALPGKLLFSDLTVDATSGQVTLRAEVPNPKGDLLPGLFVKVRVSQAQSDNAILVPQQAVTRGVAGDTVLVIGEGHVPASRNVKVAAAQGNQWVVLEGLKAGEQVVVDGFPKIRPKAPVTPVPWSAAGASAPAAAAPAPASAASR